MLSELLPNKTLCFKGVIKQDGFLVISLKLMKKGFGQHNSRRYSTYLHFFNERNAQPLPENIVDSIKALPIGREQSLAVKRRLESWQIYLDLMVERAENEEVLMEYTSARLSENLRELVIQCNNLRRQVSNKKLKNAEVKLIWKDEDDIEETEKVGTVRRFIYEKDLVEIELDDDYVEFAKQNKWSPVLKWESTY